jgi:hypothetical protein
VEISQTEVANAARERIDWNDIGLSKRRKQFWAARSPMRLPRCSRHLHSRPSAIPRLFVRLDLKPVHQLVEPTEEIDDGHKFEHGGIVQTQLLHRRSVYLESIPAPLDGGHGDCDDLLREAVKFPLLDHDRLDLVPVGFQMPRFGSHDLIKIRNEVNAKSCLNLVVNRSYLACCIRFRNHLDGSHCYHPQNSLPV